jgi:hypothetical protein
MRDCERKYFPCVLAKGPSPGDVGVARVQGTLGPLAVNCSIYHSIFVTNVILHSFDPCEVRKYPENIGNVQKYLLLTADRPCVCLSIIK